MANAHLKKLVRECTLPNLFDICPPFQIDGNFGEAGGIAEILLQSELLATTGGQDCQIDLLPALPKEWANGSIKGLRTRGGFELDLAWKGGALVSAILKGITGTRCKVSYSGKAADCTLKPETR